MKISTSPDNSRLLKLALAQGGFFTAWQAVGCGYAQKNHHYYLKAKHWESVLRGIYKYKPIESENSEYWLWYLWSCGKQKKPLGIFSHETALLMYELGDVNPSKIHLSVPKSFRRSSAIPKILSIHKKDIIESDVKTIGGLRVTTPIRTLVDLHEEDRVSDELIEKATKAALEKGHISRADLKKHHQLAKFTL